MKRAQYPGHVVAGLLYDARFADACAGRDMGAVFRMLNHRGVSTRRLAESAGISQGRLYDYMNGKSRVEKLSVFEEIADGLRIPGRLLGIASRPWEPQPPPSGIEAQTAPAGDDVSVVTTFREADKAAGGGRLYQAVPHHSTRRSPGGSSIPKAMSKPSGEAAAFSEMAGWTAHDSGRDALAARHFQRASHLAHASGDWSSAGNVAVGISHLALQTGDPSKAAHWAAAGPDIAARGPTPGSAR